MPLKVFILSAGAFGVRYRTFVLVFLLARIPRFFGLAYLGAQLGEHSGAWLKMHSLQIGLFAVLLFACLFLLVKLSERFHRRPTIE
jgi:uncharacterized membrane protein YdjX (TVP38/TMEM64 family)